MATLMPQPIAPAPLGKANSLLTFRKAKNVFCQGLCVIAAAIAVGALGIVLFYLLSKGFHYLTLPMLTQGPTPQGEPGGGLRNAIVGTLVLIAIASVIGLPLGILGGVYQLESRGKFGATVRFLTDVLNSIPSIVIGLFVYILVVVPSANALPKMMNSTALGHLIVHLVPSAKDASGGYSALAGGLALGFLMVPTVMRTTEEILRLVPNTMREASLALGAPRWRTMWSILLPSARGGIITGVMLAISRVAGETAPLLFTALGNSNFNANILKPIDALPLTIFSYAASPYDYLHNQALAGAILLIGIIFVMSLAARYATRGGMVSDK